MDNEEWRPVVGYEDLYEVSDKGNVRSLERKVTAKHGDTLYTCTRKSKLLKPCLNGEYLCVSLTKDGQKKLVRVHRLVAIAFIPNPDGKACVNHLDEVKTHNQRSNLEWCTHKENSNYGTVKQRRFETYMRNRTIRYLGEGAEMASSIEKVAKALRVSPATIRLGLEQGVLPFGAAIKCDRRCSYVLFPEEVKRLVGVDINEEEKGD